MVNGDDRRRSSGLGGRRPSPGDADPGTGAAAPSSSPAERLERERRRAVRAEGRLAEIEMVLRRALERANGHGVSAPELRSLLESVHSRVASLEDEVRASERELLDIVAAQRESLGAMSLGRAELAYDLEDARQELQAAVDAEAGGLGELSRRRLEFEAQLDRLQALVDRRQGVCDSLTGELQEGARIAGEVASRLADLARGRVAAPRRHLAEDARAVALRHTLEKEQAELYQARRALEAARAEIKVAQRAAVEAEEKAAGRLLPLEQRLRELEAERGRLQAELESAEMRAAAERGRLEQALDRERAGRVQANEAVRILERRLVDLERQLTISGEEREESLRTRLAESEKERERIEAERIRLAERVSLLQATQAAQAARAADVAAEAATEDAGKTADERRAKGKVVALLQDRPSEAPGDTDDAAELLLRRQSDLDKLSGRWRRLQAAYQEAVAEFDEVRAKRDRMLHKRPPTATPPQAGAAPTGDVTASGAGARPPRAEQSAESWVIEESAARRPVMVLLDDRPELIAALRAVAARRGVPLYAGTDRGAPPAGELHVIANLMAGGPPVLPALAELARGGRTVRALLYGATADAGRVFGAVDVFPAPFDAVACAARLLGIEPRLRRVMTVGEFADMMSRLRELLGRSRCSTAVAFDRRQALDLVTLVRPEYVLVDLALANGAAYDLLSELGGMTEPALRLGVTWSRPIPADELQAAVAGRLASVPLDPQMLADAAAAIVFDRQTPAQ